MAGLGIGIGLGGGGGAGGLGITTTRVAPTGTGTVAQLRAGLRGALTYSKLSGASAVAITASGAVGLSAALGAGGSASFVARVANESGDAVERAFTLAAVAATPSPSPTPSPTPTPALAGFYGGGASNSILSAALARVRNGTGRSRWVMVGDSTTVGQGAGTGADPYGLTGARANRPASVLAGLLAGSGIPAGDKGFLGSHALPSEVTLPAYHGTVAFGGTTQNRLDLGMGAAGDSSLAGFATFGGDGALNTWRDPQCDSFEAVLMRNASGFFSSFVDSASTQYDRPATPGSGFDRFVHPTRAGSAGAHLLAMALSGSGGAFSLASVMAFDSTVPAVDLVVQAHCGATSAQLASSNVGNNARSSLDYLKLMAPDLTVINLGLNDIAGGVPAASYAANLGAIIAAAKLSGDVLLDCPPPAGGSFADMAAHEAAAKARAAADGVAFLSLREYYGNAFTPALAARYYDGLVHPRAEFYAEMAGLMKQAVAIMAPAAFT